MHACVFLAFSECVRVCHGLQILVELFTFKAWAARRRDRAVQHGAGDGRDCKLANDSIVYGEEKGDGDEGIGGFEGQRSEKGFACHCVKSPIPNPDA